jgi:hypothetical protein
MNVKGMLAHALVLFTLEPANPSGSEKVSSSAGSSIHG